MNGNRKVIPLDVLLAELSDAAGKARLKVQMTPKRDAERRRMYKLEADLLSKWLPNRLRRLGRKLSEVTA